MKEYSSRISYVVNQMKIYGDNISNQHVIEKILLSILVKFDYDISVMQQRKDTFKLFMVELLGALEA